jgi:dimethylargininase
MFGSIYDGKMVISAFMWKAIVREISPRFADCELTHKSRVPIDLELANQQHDVYRDALRSAGCEVIVLPSEPDLPDSVFVEDAALVLDEVAVITRPGANSRKPETLSISAALAPYRDFVHIHAPDSLDGGDVTVVGKRVYVGISSRTDAGALQQLSAYLGPHGYQVLGLPVSGCLHLKSAVTTVGENRVLLNPDWVRRDAFGEFEIVETDPSEPEAGNALWIGDRVIYSSSFPRTADRMRRIGIDVIEVPASECAKAEGGVTCCSLIFR